MRAADFQVQNDRALFRKAGLAASIWRSNATGNRGGAEPNAPKTSDSAWPLDGLFCDLFNSRRSECRLRLARSNAGGTATGTTISGREYRLLYSSFRYSPYHPPLPRTALEYAQDERCRLRICQLSMKSKRR
jgi:hypothetical protein